MASVVDTLRARAPLLWTRITIDARPDVSLMISLLTDMGVQMNSRPSGSACLKVLLDNVDLIEDRLRAAHVPPTPEPLELPPPAVEPSPPPPPPRHDEEAFVEDIDASMQCANTLLAEAHERLVTCVLTSFRTDSGLIMLENELSLFQEETPDTVAAWVTRTRDAWSSRLHSKVLDDFHEALDLWVVSQRLLH